MVGVEACGRDSPEEDRGAGAYNQVCDSRFESSCVRVKSWIFLVLGGSLPSTECFVVGV